jgi:hypothetical protein
VRLVEIDVIGLQPAQGRVRRLHDVLAGKAAVVQARAGRPVDLREDLDGLAAHAVQCPAEHCLGGRARVDVRGVEGGDSLVERRRDTCPGGVFLDL